jgi:excinuclease ABC subunit A
MDQSIIISGARQHNLKNIHLALPRNKLIVITGVSGSGKSSLAFNTLFAEGQRRYIEALSTSARHFLHQLDAPEVDEIRGLSPAIAIEQKGLPRNPRSTVGTLTEIHDHLRLLYTHLGTVFCPQCNLPIRAYTILQMSHEIQQDWPEGSRLLILAPLVPIDEKNLPNLLKRLRKDGFARIRSNGRIYELEPLPHLPRSPSYDIDIVVDRLILKHTQESRLLDSLELASKMGHGTVTVVRIEGDEKVFSESHQCLSCGFTAPEMSPSLFSFQHPLGSCPVCKGLGYVTERAHAGQAEKPSRPRTEGIDWDCWMEEPFNDSDEMEEGQVPCPGCRGTRLNDASRSVRLNGLGIHEVSRLSIPAIRQWILKLPLSPSQELIAERPRREILFRLSSLEELGLSYLTLDRPANTLSGGEAQRIRLAHQISAPLSGVLYVLDEPSIGLHPRDHERLIQVLFRLRDSGNTVVVVEHDRETILQADYVVDMGPGAGVQGGEVLFEGPPEALKSHTSSLTGLYLSGKKSIPIPNRRKPFQNGALTLTGARGHNLKGITVQFPLGCLICVTGVSGSGKSTLVMHTLYRALAQKFYRSKVKPEPFSELQNTESIEKVILIDQSPLGRTPRSTPATYSGVFDQIRQLFSRTPDARAAGFSPSRFSFNAKGGRCESCRGEGFQRIDMYFLPDIYVTCSVCNGSRFNAETLKIQIKGKSIAEVLDMSVMEAMALFENFPAIHHKLQTFLEVGLGYLRLGQPATTLSGGEAQRVRLATELSRKTGGKTLYILDEPTTGLHFEDILRLLQILQRLVDRGNTVILIEHHPDVIKTADYVIDLGPEGGEEGGYIVATGRPEEIVEAGDSQTGLYLRRFFVSGDGDV